MAPITTVTIDFWELVLAVCAVVVFIGVLFALGFKLVLDQLEKRSTDRDEVRQRALAEVSKKVTDIESDVRQLASILPNEYVRREDWIRFSGTIDTKLDWLREKQDDMRTTVTRLVERVDGYMGGKHNGR